MAYLKWQGAKKILGVSASIVLAVVVLLNLAGMEYTIPSDITCGSDCYSEIKVNSTFWAIKVEHSGDAPILYKKMTRSRTLWLNLDRIEEFVPTNPKVEVEILVPTIKKYSTMKHEEFGYLRPIKDGDYLIERYSQKYNPDGDRFIIHGKKGTSETVKWGMSLEHWLSEDIKFDPIWEGEVAGGGIQIYEVPSRKITLLELEHPFYFKNFIVTDNSLSTDLIVDCINISKPTKATINLTNLKGIKDITKLTINKTDVTSVLSKVGKSWKRDLPSVQIKCNTSYHIELEMDKNRSEYTIGWGTGSSRVLINESGTDIGMNNSHISVTIGKSRGYISALRFRGYNDNNVLDDSGSTQNFLRDVSNVIMLGEGDSDDSCTVVENGPVRGRVRCVSAEDTGDWVAEFYIYNEVNYTDYVQLSIQSGEKYQAYLAQIGVDGAEGAQDESTWFINGTLESSSYECDNSYEEQYAQCNIHIGGVWEDKSTPIVKGFLSSATVGYGSYVQYYLWNETTTGRGEYVQSAADYANVVVGGTSPALGNSTPFRVRIGFHINDSRQFWHETKDELYDAFITVPTIKDTYGTCSWRTGNDFNCTNAIGNVTTHMTADENATHVHIEAGNWSQGNDKNIYIYNSSEASTSTDLWIRLEDVAGGWRYHADTFGTACDNNFINASICNYTQIVNASGGQGFYVLVQFGNVSGQNITISNTSLPASDTTPPQFKTNATNTTTVSEPINFTITITDNTDLDAFIFEQNNSGHMYNSSAVIISGTSYEAGNGSLILNSTIGMKVQWRFFANDSSNNWNASAPYNVTTTGKTNPKIHMSLNGTENNQTYVYGGYINITGWFETGDTANTWRNRKNITLIGNSTSPIGGNGTENSPVVVNITNIMFYNITKEGRLYNASNHTVKYDVIQNGTNWVQIIFPANLTNSNQTFSFHYNNPSANDDTSVFLNDTSVGRAYYNGTVFPNRSSLEWRQEGTGHSLIGLYDGKYRYNASSSGSNLIWHRLINVSSVGGYMEAAFKFCNNPLGSKTDIGYLSLDGMQIKFNETLIINSYNSSQNTTATHPALNLSKQYNVLRLAAEDYAIHDETAVSYNNSLYLNGELLWHNSTTTMDLNSINWKAIDGTEGACIIWTYVTYNASVDLIAPPHIIVEAEEDLEGSNKLYRNGTLIASGVTRASSIDFIGAGVWNYTFVYEETANYSALSNFTFATVEKADTSLSLWFNGSVQNLTVGLEEMVNITAKLNATLNNVTVYLDINETDYGNNYKSNNYTITNITSTDELSEEGFALFNVTAHFDGDANYTLSNNFLFLTVSNISISVNFPTDTTAYKINISTCVGPGCYQNGTFYPQNQTNTSTGWIWEINNTGNVTVNLTTYFDSALDNCMMVYLVNSSNFLLNNTAFNISSTPISLNHTFPENAFMHFWSWIYYNNCTAGTYFDEDWIFEVK